MYRTETFHCANPIIRVLLCSYWWRGDTRRIPGFCMAELTPSTKSAFPSLLYPLRRGEVPRARGRRVCLFLETMSQSKLSALTQGDWSEAAQSSRHSPPLQPSLEAVILGLFLHFRQIMHVSGGRPLGMVTGSVCRCATTKHVPYDCCVQIITYFIKILKQDPRQQHTKRWCLDVAKIKAIVTFLSDQASGDVKEDAEDEASNSANALAKELAADQNQALLHRSRWRSFGWSVVSHYCFAMLFYL